MYLWHTDFELPRAGVRFRQDDLRGKDFIVARVRAEGGILDEALEPPVGARASGWNRLRLLVRGRLGASDMRDLRADEALLSKGFLSAPMRSLTSETEHIDVYWRADAPLETGSVRVHGEALEAFRTALEGNDLDVVETALVGLVESVRADGIAIALPETGDTRARAVGRALEESLGDLRHGASMADLASRLGVGERQATRRINDHFAAFHVTVSSWREYLQRLRLELGALLMTAPTARTEDVSQLLGFASPTSFCHALHKAGMPSPVAIQARARN